MAAETPASQPSGKDRREYYRITVTLPVRIQLETDTTEGELVQKSVNISGGGIGVQFRKMERAANLRLHGFVWDRMLERLETIKRERTAL